VTRRQAWRRAGWAWCILASTTATLGGILGWLEHEDDRT
jgi:hypothetical protein